VLSDLHADLGALEAAIADATRKGADRIVIAGDVVGDGPQPAEVVALLRSSAFPTVMGNVDEKVLQTARFSSPQQDALLEKRKKADLVRTARALSRRDLAWLAALPSSLTLRLGGAKLLLVHGSPAGNTDYVFPSITPAALAAKLGDARPDVLACGHSHIPFARRIKGVTVVNAGSIGRPIDGDERGSYALVEVVAGAPPRGRIVRFRSAAPDLQRCAERGRG